MKRDFAGTASLIGEPARAVMLLKLLGGKALPAGELAHVANITPQTASGHLGKLIEGQFVSVQQQGRHRYYRLASAEVADALEALLVLTPDGRQRAQQVKPGVGTLAHARTCYMHLAGWLGVRLTDALQVNGFLCAQGDKIFTVTDAGRGWFGELGIVIPPTTAGIEAKFARQCLDWTERKPHISGTLGRTLYRRMVERKWLVSIPHTRIVRVTLEGKQQLWKQLRIPIA